MVALEWQTPEQQAADHFARGQKLYDKGNYAAALAEFEAAYQKTQAWEVLLNIGVTEENLQHYNGAVRALDRYLKEGADKVAPDRKARVESELRHIRSVVGEVSVTVPGAPATVEVDGRVVGSSPLPEGLLLAAGPHRLRVTRPGEIAADRTVEVKVGERTEVELSPTVPAKRPTTAELAVD